MPYRMPCRSAVGRPICRTVGYAFRMSRGVANSPSCRCPVGCAISYPLRVSRGVAIGSTARNSRGMTASVAVSVACRLPRGMSRSLAVRKGSTMCVACRIAVGNTVSIP